MLIATRDPADFLGVRRWGAGSTLLSFVGVLAGGPARPPVDFLLRLDDVLTGEADLIAKSEDTSRTLVDLRLLDVLGSAALDGEAEPLRVAEPLPDLRELEDRASTLGDPDPDSLDTRGAMGKRC